MVIQNFLELVEVALVGLLFEFLEDGVVFLGGVVVPLAVVEVA